MTADRPKLASISAGNAAVYQGDSKVGTAHFTNVVTKRGSKGAEMFFASVVLNDGTITLQARRQGPRMLRS